MQIKIGSIRIFTNRHLALVRIGPWTRYALSVFKFGRVKWPGYFENWSLGYVTLERRLRELPKGSF